MVDLLAPRTKLMATAATTTMALKNRTATTLVSAKTLTITMTLFQIGGLIPKVKLKRQQVV